MVNPQFVEEKPLSFADVKVILTALEKRDIEFNYLSKKSKDYLEAFPPTEKREELHQKLMGLNLTRLKEEHLMKIIDFLPRTVNDLKIVLSAYPLSLPKKDQESIVQVIQELVPSPR